MKADKKEVVDAYNQIADWFSENRPQHLMERSYLDSVINIIGKGTSVLDLGCGTGKPIMQYFLVQGIDVTGIDISYRMLEIAKTNFPSVNFIQADMRTLSLDQNFDAIIAWNSFFHLPAEDQPAMFPVFKNLLKKGGALLFTSGTKHGEAWGINNGISLFHGSLDTSQYQSLLKQNHFQVIQYKENDPQCGHLNVWLTRKH